MPKMNCGGSLWGWKHRWARLARVAVLAGVGCAGLAGLARADWSDAMNPTLVAGTAGTEILTDMESDGYYGLLLGWRSNLGSHRLIVAQHFDPVATKKWGTNGLTLSRTSLGTPQVSVAPDGLRGGYVAWVDDADLGTSSRVWLARVRENASTVTLSGTVAVTMSLAGTLNFTSGSRTVTNYVALTGTLTFVQGSTTVTGSGTSFATELSEGDYIRLASWTSWYRVARIVSGTELVITPAASEGGSGAAVKKGASLLSQVAPGEYILRTGDSTSYKVESVTESVITLESNYGGSTGTSSATNLSRVYGLITLAGTVSFSAGSATVTGTNTRFLYEVSAGDFIRLASSSVWHEVKAVVSNTELVLTAQSTETGSGNAINGSRADTMFLSETRPGDFISFDGGTTWLKIGRVLSNTALSLAAPFTGTAPAPGQALASPTLSLGNLTVQAADRTKVDGDGTVDFTAMVEQGDFIQLAGDDFWVQVGSVEDADTLVLAEEYPGTVGSLLSGVLSRAIVFKSRVSEDGNICHSPHVLAGSGGVYVAYVNDSEGIPTNCGSTLTGTLSFTSGSRTVSGVGTKFRVEVGVGDYIRVGTNPWAQVESIESDTSLTLVTQSSYTASGAGSITTDITGVVPRLELAYFDDEGYMRWRTNIGYVHPRHTGYRSYDRDHSIRLFSAPNGGVIVVWNEPMFVDENGTLQRAGSTRAARFNSNGEGVWGVEPVQLFRRGEDPLNPDIVNVASVAPDGSGGLWVAGRWWFPDGASGVTVDDGNYVVVNRLSASGAMNSKWWKQSLEWKSIEKGKNNTVPRYATYRTNQHTPRVVSDGAGGVYVQAKDTRRSGTAGPGTNLLTGLFNFTTGDAHVTGTDGALDVELQSGDYVRRNLAGAPWYRVLYVYAANDMDLETAYAEASATGVEALRPGYFYPYENIFAQHLKQQSTGFTPYWFDNSSGYYWYWVGSTLVQVDYKWYEGEEVRIAPCEKRSPELVCAPWTSWHPVEGTQLRNPLVSVWSEDLTGSFIIMATELDENPTVDYGDAMHSWPSRTIEVCNTTSAPYRIFVVGEPQFGVYVGWTDSGGDIYVSHFNYYKIFEGGRVPAAVGPGPDIFSPPPVASFTARPGPGKVTLTWTNPRTSPGGVKPLKDWAGTMIRRSTSGFPLTPYDGDFIYAGPETGFVDTDVVSGITYYYAAFTFDTEFAEPNFSGPVWRSALVGFSDVENFTAQGLNRAVLLSWRNPAGEDYEGVIILRSTSRYPTLDDLEDVLAGSPPPDVKKVGTFASSTQQYTDNDDGAGLVNGTTYYYTAFSYDDSGDISDPSNLPNFSSGTRASAAPISKVDSLTATGADGQVGLSWTISDTTGLVGVIIRRSQTGFPQTISDGAPVGGGVFPLTTTAYTDANLTNGTTYYYSAFAIDSSYNSSAPTSASAVPGDYVPPDSPTGMSAIAGDRVVHLSWINPTASDLAAVVIIRSTTTYPTSPSDGTKIYTLTNPVIGGLATFDDTNVVNNTSTGYYYAAFGIDDADNVSAPSTSARTWANPVDVTGPGPLSLSATRSDLAINLSWALPTDADLAGLLILRRTDHYPTLVERMATGTVVVLDTPVIKPDPTNPSSWTPTSVTDQNVSDGVTYYYTAWAYDDETPANYSTPSSVDVTATANVPPWFVGVTVSNITAHEADIAWATNEPCKFVLRWGTTPSGHVTYRTTAYSSTGFYNFTALRGGTRYYYKITGTDAGGATTSDTDPLATGYFDTDPLDSSEDADGDGMEDAWEASYGVSDPVLDPDGDGLSNLDEYRHGTNPTVPDTDGDGINDGDEVANGLDPLSRGAAIPASEEGCGGASGGSPVAALTLIGLFVALSVRVWKKRVRTA